MFHVKPLVRDQFDIVVVGGGHAGIEAASIAARMGCCVALVTFDPRAIGRLSCNPAIGGMAKGQLVCEIDALGGEMATIADASGIQFKTLGTSKGPAMWSPRSQNDKDLYPQIAQHRLNLIDNLVIIEDAVDDVIIEGGRVTAVRLLSGRNISCGSLIVCSGTFLRGRMFTGMTSTVGGRVGERSAESLSSSLGEIGLKTGRLKTGTPPRILKDSVDFGLCQADPGDLNPLPFSRSTTAVSNQVDCYLTATSTITHELLRKGFDRSPMFTGKITGIGPRYCPSIEDKIFRFADRDSHQIFLEPEGLESSSIYVNGFSTSLPEDIQLSGLQSIPPLRECKVLRFGYAVEYDFVPSYQLNPTLESKLVRGLYFAGQVNGTSGYEEAAAQGLMAGINAVLANREEAPFILDRSTSYIGVLIDDLVNLTISEPYRMFTSRAEWRLLLRRDNADLRLTPFGGLFGTVSIQEVERVERKRLNTVRAIQLLEELVVDNSDMFPDVNGGQKAWQLLKRPQVGIDDVISSVNTDSELYRLLSDPQVIEQVEIEAKYGGYLNRQRREIESLSAFETALIPVDLDYSQIRSLSSEGREKLNQVRPRSIGQASRIAGVSRSDVTVLSIYVK